jgi:hypothetical protein
MALTYRGSGEQGRAGPPLSASDDYLLDTDLEVERPPAGQQAVRLLQAVLFVVIAALSFAVFWMVGLMLGVL